jgi:hypothetical protein
MADKSLGCICRMKLISQLVRYTNYPPWASAQGYGNPLLPPSPLIPYSLGHRPAIRPLGLPTAGWETQPNPLRGLGVPRWVDSSFVSPTPSYAWGITKWVDSSSQLPPYGRQKLSSSMGPVATLRDTTLVAPFGRHNPTSGWESPDETGLERSSNGAPPLRGGATKIH